jgi:RNA polymerase sigma factor (sigma-70 family)
VAQSEDATSAPCAKAVRLADAFVQCSDAVYRFILYRVGGDRNTADELLQDCCHEAIRHKHPPTDPDRFGAWVVGIARNLIRRHWRHRRRDQRHQPFDHSAMGPRLLERLESSGQGSIAGTAKAESDALMRAVTALATSEQRLVFGVYFQGQSLEQLALEEQTTAKAIEARLYRIRVKLRELLRDPTKAGDA